MARAVLAQKSSRLQRDGCFFSDCAVLALI